jgi:hypothetical protein
LREKPVPKFHKLFDEVFGSLLFAVPIYPKVTHVEDFVVENTSLESATMTACRNLIFEMLCAISDFTRILERWATLVAKIVVKVTLAVHAPFYAKVMPLLKPFTPNPFVQMVRGDNRVQGVAFRRAMRGNKVFLFLVQFSEKLLCVYDFKACGVARHANSGL